MHPGQSVGRGVNHFAVCGGMGCGHNRFLGERWVPLPAGTGGCDVRAFAMC